MKAEETGYSKTEVRGAIKGAAVIALIISVIALLWGGVMIFVSGEVRNHNAVDIDDTNRDEIAQLADIAKYKETIDGESYNGIPDLKDAVRVDHLSLMHKDEINFLYKDGSSYRVFARAYDNPLVSYVDDNGYNLYYSNENSEFSGDLIAIAVPFVFFCASVVTLIVIRKKNTDAEGSARKYKQILRDKIRGAHASSPYFLSTSLDNLNQSLKIVQLKSCEFFHKQKIF